jgi:hypothetical protein
MFLVVWVGFSIADCEACLAELAALLADSLTELVAMIELFSQIYSGISSCQRGL